MPGRYTMIPCGCSLQEDGTRHDDEKHLGPVPAADLHRSLPAIAVPAMHRMESQICAEAVLSSIATNGTIASPVDTEGDSTGVFLDETVKVVNKGYLLQVWRGVHVD